MHQVEAFHVDLLASAQRNGAGVIDDNIDAAECFGCRRQGLGHLRLVAHVHGQGQGLAAGRLDLLRSGEDRARQFGMRLGGLGGYGDIGAVARGAQSDSEAYAARGAGDEQGFASKSGHEILLRLIMSPQDCFAIRGNAMARKTFESREDFRASGI